MESLCHVLSIVPCLWQCSTKHSAHIRDLEENLNSLRTAKDKLDALSQDVRNRVREAEEQRMRRRNIVNHWLESVEAKLREVDQILQKGAEELGNRCLGRHCPRNCRSSYKLGKEVLKMVSEVTRLMEEGQFDVIADQLPPPPVDELPMENAVVGYVAKFQELWHAVGEKESMIVGLVGMGGAGKTTLLKQLNNQFMEASHGFDLVIWITVSRPINLGRIRDAIRSKLNIPDHLWENKSEEQRVSLISSRLKEKKFVVLLDDLWDTLKLSDVGIPKPCQNNMSKVVITTRSRKVCNSMETDKVIEVRGLPPDEAFRLFCSKVGEDMLKSHPELERLVKDVANECQGLPLALITIGRAMRGKMYAHQWVDAKRELEKYPSTFPGMEDEVFVKLKFSYDNLGSATLQKCFEYCAIFPEDEDIEEEEIIRLWLAEGLIDEYDSIYHAHSQGQRIIESLMQASLLEVGRLKVTTQLYLLETRGLQGTVKMHDVIRAMALWLACECEEKKNKFWVNVYSGDQDDTPIARAKWMSNAEKVSLWGRGTSNVFLERLSFCSNLTTLIIRHTQLSELPGEVFRCMKVVKVLDLSKNMGLGTLPSEICAMINLEYLNIVETFVRRLPAEVVQLKKLRFLLLNHSVIIPRGVISSLLSLQMFESHMQSSEFNIKLQRSEYGSDRESMETEMLKELDGLEHMMNLFLVFCFSTSFQILLDSPKLRSYTTRLSLFRCNSLPAVVNLCSSGRSMKHLERLTLVLCDMSVIKLGEANNCLHKLRHITIFGCRKIRNVSSLVHVPNLCILDVRHCESMEELVGEDGKEENVGMPLFCNLTTLILNDLRELRSICPQNALPFPSLKWIYVSGCYTLQKLPFDSTTLSTIPPEFRIEGSKYWWDDLKWESPTTKDAFTRKFHSQNFVRFHGLYNRFHPR